MIKNFKRYFLIALVVGLSSMTLMLKYRNNYLEGVNKDLEAKVASFNTMIKQAEQDVNKTEIRIQEKVVYRTEQSKPIYKYIETYKGDSNASNCDNNMSLLRSFAF